MLSVFTLEPNAKCFACSIGDGNPVTVSLKDGTSRPATAQEVDWMWFPPEDDIELLEDLNRDEAGAVVCEQCSQFHPSIEKAPVRTMYWGREQPQPLLCPECIKAWDEYWDEMWK